MYDRFRAHSSLRQFAPYLFLAFTLVPVLPAQTLCASADLDAQQHLPLRELRALPHLSCRRRRQEHFLARLRPQPDLPAAHFFSASGSGALDVPIHLDPRRNIPRAPHGPAQRIRPPDDSLEHRAFLGLLPATRSPRAHPALTATVPILPNSSRQHCFRPSARR